MKATQQGVFKEGMVSSASAALLVLAGALVIGPKAVLRAQTVELQLVPSNAVPRLGTFYSIQLSNVPPLPFDPYPQLDVYSLSDAPGRYWVDDRAVDYVAVREQMEMETALQSLESQYGLDSLGGPPPIPGGGGGGGGNTNGSGNGYYVSYPDGSLWLDIAQLTNGEAPLTIHGTSSELYYEMQSKLTLPGGSWTSEGGLLGATNQNWTPVLIAVGNRTNCLFFRAHMVTNCDGYFTPPAWYVQYGLNPLSPGIGTQDADSDGLLNYQEYLWGANPVHAEGFSVWVSSPGGYCGIP